MVKAVGAILWKYVPTILATSLIFLTLFSWFHVQKSFKQVNTKYFDQLISDTNANLQERFVLYRQSLLGGLGVFYSSNNVERSEWKKYVETLNINKYLPGINGVGYIDYVEETELEEYLEKVRADDAPDFTNKPETTFSDKFVIRYIEPEHINKEAVGLDIGFENHRRMAAEYARDHGTPTLTKKIELVQDQKKSPGFLFLVPVYEGNTTPEDISSRREKILGWVYAPFIGAHFLQDMTKISKNQISFSVYDGDAKKEKHLIYSSHPELLQGVKAQITKDTHIVLGHRTWTIEWVATPLFTPPSNSNFSYVILLTGFLLAFVLYYSLRTLIRSKEIIAREIDKQTEQLKKSKEFLSLIMNSIPDLVFVKDKKFRIVRANQAFLNIFPPDKRDKVIGYTTAENFSKKEQEIFFSQDRIAFANGVSQTNEDIELYSGKILNLFTTKIRFYDENGQEFILCIARDITNLIEIQRDLEKEVEKRTLEYKEQKTIAEKAGQAKENFLANMSHELRTPLNSIIGLTKILIDEANLKGEHKEIIGIIDKASNHLLKTVNDILDISKLEAGKVKLEKTNINLSGLMHSIIDQIKPLASQKGLVVKDNLQDLKNLFVSADEHRISRIITNLIGNAVKYTDEGYVKIHFESNETRSNIIDFVVTVADTGVGIPQDKIDSIFDKFAQADKSTERLYGGTGLGLSITRELVELMGGEISVTSEMGVGSVFTVRLPLQVGTEESRNDNLIADKNKKLEKVPTVELKKARILVAEDHEFNQVFIKKMLKRFGIKNYVIAKNGAEALASFKKKTFDLVLMDYHMPRMNGYVVTENIRRFEDMEDTDFNVPIIAMTADVMPGTEEKCLEAGMNDYISKPIDENILLKKIEKWLLVSGKKDTLENQVSDEDNISDENDKETFFDLKLLHDYTDGDLQAQKELIEIFYAKSKSDIDVLKRNCIDGKSKEWVEAAHSLKGSSSYISANVLKNLCAVAQGLDDATKEERIDLYKKIKKTHEKLCNSLRNENLLGE